MPPLILSCATNLLGMLKEFGNHRSSDYLIEVVIFHLISFDWVLSGFEVRYRPRGSDESWAMADTPSYRVTLRGLEESTEYDVNVIAISDIGESEPLSGTVTTKAARRELHPTVLRIGLWHGFACLRQICLNLCCVRTTVGQNLPPG